MKQSFKLIRNHNMEIETLIKSEIEAFIAKMKYIYSDLIGFIDASDDREEKFEKLINTYEKHITSHNKGEFRLIFQLISKISDNHHLTTEFLDKIENFFRYLIKDSSSSISNFILDYTNYNKRILFLLIEKKLIKPNESFIIEYLLSKNDNKGFQSFYYLYPKMKEFLEEKMQKQIEKEISEKFNEDISTFEEKCQIGENDSYICSLIREDSIEDFVSYVNTTNFNLSAKIKPSIFETNSFLIDKEPTLIEYAAFFGAIQIIHYMKYNNVPLTFSLWIYAIHSNNAEIIHFLENNGVKPEKDIKITKESFDDVFIESIKCHRITVSNYIKDNFYEQIQTNDHFFENFNDAIVNSLNFYFFPNQIVSIIWNKKKFNLVQLRFLLVKISIPSSVTFIGDGAFYGCSSLTQIIFESPSFITSIGNDAFSKCLSLAQISIPSSATSIGNNAFYKCSSLTQISFEIPSFITSIENGIFYGCSSLTKIQIPPSVTSIRNGAFYKCSSLTQITIPSSVSSIGYYAFYKCISLTQISFEIPSSIISIGDVAFYGCSSLKQISIPSTVISIGIFSFSECSSLSQIKIPSSVTSIENYAFYGCSSLTQLILENPSSLTKIGNFSFSRCSPLIRKSIPSSLSSIGIDTISECSQLIPKYIPLPKSSIKDSSDESSSSIQSTSYTNVAEKLMESVSYEGEIENAMSNNLFSSFNDPKIWSPFDLDCAIPNSSFYIARINSNLTISNVNTDDHDQNGSLYLVLRYTKDDIIKYLDYLKLEYNSYLNMENQMNESIFPVGYTRNISKEGFIFVFLTSTNLTLYNAIDYIKDLPFEERFSYAIKLINNINEAFIEQKITGFYLTPKTILINKQEESICLIGFIGCVDELKLCSITNEFSSFLIPNSISDALGLAKIVHFIIGDDISIPKFKEVMTSILQKNPSNRISLYDFTSQVLEIQKEISLIKEGKPTHPLIRQIRLVDIIKELSVLTKTKEDYPKIYELPSIITQPDPSKKIRRITVGPQIKSLKKEIKILIVGETGSGKTTFINCLANYLYGVQWEDDFRFIVTLEETDFGQYQTFNRSDYLTAYTFYWQPGFAVPYTVTLIDTSGFGFGTVSQRDHLFFEQIESLFKNENDYGIDSLNAVAFTINSSRPRIDSTNRFIFNSILIFFGKDVLNNFIIAATFADAGEPFVLDALRENQIPTDYVSKFNNSAFYGKCRGDIALINRLFWEMNQKNYASIFEFIEKMEPLSLSHVS